MRIAVIGAGKVGSALGTGWAKAGHTIVFGVRREQGGVEGSVRENWRNSGAICERGPTR